MFQKAMRRLVVVITITFAASVAMVSPASAADWRYMEFGHSGKCLEIPGWSTANSTQADQWDCVNQANVQWDLWLVGNWNGHGVYQLVNRHSNKCLDVQGKSTANGARIIQYTCQNANNQKWYLQPMGDGFALVTSMHSHKCINISGASNANGAKAIQWDCGVNRGNDQVAFIPV